MMTKHKAQFAKNANANTIKVIKEIDAPIQKVWNAWTNASQLDQWWGPKPWKAVTKKMDFKEGGSWLYYMSGPKGEKQWSRSDFHKIDTLHSFTSTDAFTDEKGNTNKDMPSMQWETKFIPIDHGTKVEVNLKLDSREDFDKIIKTGFEEGFLTGLDQLEDLLSE